MFQKSYDTIICGGGPAGVAAAVAAARTGAKTLLIEQTGALGGMGTNGLVPAFAPFSWHKNAPLITGLAGEILKKLATVGGSDLELWPSIDPEKLKLVYDRLIVDSGVTLRFFTTLADIEKSGKKLVSIITQSKFGKEKFQGKTFVDATGDADLSYLAGCPTEKGGADGNLQAVSLCFMLAGINSSELLMAAGDKSLLDYLREKLDLAIESEKLKNTANFQYRIMMTRLDVESGIVPFNFGHIFGIDGTNPDLLTKAMLAGRLHVHDFVTFLKNEVPGMTNARVVATASLPGVRETRRIKGEFVLRSKAFTDSERHEDDIAVYDYPPDVHDSRHFHQRTEMTNPYMELAKIAREKIYGIPFRSLIPLGINNLLVAGRCISADRPMQGSTRVMPSCIATGQAAGTAAAICVLQNLEVSQLDFKELYQELDVQNTKNNGIINQ